MYRRLLHDSTDNLIQPTAQAIGNGTTKVSQMPFQPSQGIFASAKNSMKNQTRKLASANIRNKRAYSSNAYAPPKNYASSSRAVSSQGHRILQQRMHDQHNTNLQYASKQKRILSSAVYRTNNNPGLKQMPSYYSNNNGTNYLSNNMLPSANKVARTILTQKNGQAITGQRTPV